MQKRGLILLSIATILIAGIIFALAFTSRNTAQPDSCSQVGKAHKIDIENDTMMPGEVAAKLCDSLTITNKDGKRREIGFGQHDKHVPYDGVSEKIISENEAFTITFTKTGTYHFHDHFQKEVKGSFTVTR